MRIRHYTIGIRLLAAHVQNDLTLSTERQRRARVASRRLHDACRTGCHTPGRTPSERTCFLLLKIARTAAKFVQIVEKYLCLYNNNLAEYARFN